MATKPTVLKANLLFLLFSVISSDNGRHRQKQMAQIQKGKNDPKIMGTAVLPNWGAITDGGIFLR
jgi:hypothetical protein